MFERFTERARHVVLLAQEEARTFDHNHIDSGHILLGLIREREGVAARVLDSAGVTLTAARTQVEEIIGRGAAAPSGHISFTPRAKKILELALREALQLKKSYIGPEHILLGLIREGQGVGAQILEHLGPPLPDLRQRVLEAAGTGQPGQEEATDPGEGGTGAEPGVLSWAQGWLSAARYGPNVRFPAFSALREMRETLESIDRRLGAIERHLGLAAGNAGESGGAGTGTRTGEEGGPGTQARTTL